MSYRFFQNKDCEFFPCVETESLSGFSCLFCYCPLYPFADCGGKHRLAGKNTKDCSECLLPHENYDYIIEKLREYYPFD